MPASYQKVTKIEDLEDLEELYELDEVTQPQPMFSRPAVSRHIRTHDIVGHSQKGSGMDNYQRKQEVDREPYPVYEPYEQSQPCAKDCNCAYIYDHVKECDICKRFYKPDITPYLVIILILVIACAMMAKKLFNL